MTHPASKQAITEESPNYLAPQFHRLLISVLLENQTPQLQPSRKLMQIRRYGEVGRSRETPFQSKCRMPRRKAVVVAWVRSFAFSLVRIWLT